MIRVEEKRIQQKSKDQPSEHLTWKGEWSSSSQYKACDAVSHDGAVFTALNDNQSVEPGNCPETWKVLAKAPPTTPSAELERLRLSLVNLGYVDLERDALEFLLHPGEIIKAFDSWSITTDRRVLTREGLRSVLRPASWTNLSTWMAQFPPIPKRPEEIAASRVWEQPHPKMA
jgi:hypothetical protein